MKIAVFSDNFYPELSGITDSIMKIGAELAARGHEILYIGPRYSTKNYKLVGRATGEPDLGTRIRIMRLASLPFPTGTNQGRLVIPTGRATRRMREFRPDIIHVHLPFGTGIEGLIAARRLMVPLIGTNHTPLSEFIRYSPIRGRAVTRLLLKANAWFYGHCDFVSSPTQAIFDEMYEYGFQKPHRVVSNPLDLRFFFPQKNRKALKQKYDLSPFAVLYAGRLAPEKNINLVIRAVAEARHAVPEISLGIVGKGSAEKELRALAQSLGVADRVRFLGFLEGETKLAEAHNAADVFAIMSTAETQGLVAMQALACGVPVIGARAWGLAEYLGKEKAGQILVSPGDYQSLAAELVRLAKYPQKRRALGRRGRKFTETITAPKIAGEWEEVYRETATRYHKA